MSVTEIPSPAYREHAPIAALRDRLQCAWTYRAPAGEAVSTQVIPDGCVDLIWTADRAFVAGPDRVAATAVLDAGQQLHAVRFAPGAAAALFGLPLEELVGQRVPLHDLWGRRADRMAAVLERAAPDNRLREMQHWLAGETGWRADAEMAWVFARADHESTTPRDLAHGLGVSERQLRRRCRHAFGYGPKTLMRILRLQRFLAGTAERGLLARALDAGYRDAAHLAHEVREMAGCTPRELIAARHG